MFDAIPDAALPEKENQPVTLQELLLTEGI